MKQPMCAEDHEKFFTNTGLAWVTKQNKVCCGLRQIKELGAASYFV
jgi:hypothetical protein